MKRSLLLGVAFASMMSLSATAGDVGDDMLIDDSEMYGDIMESRMQDVEWVLENNPALMNKIIADSLRENPGIVKDIIRDTLLRNPEIVVGSLQEYQRQQQAGQAQAAAEAPDAELSADFLQRVRSSADAPVRGNPAGTVTIVEFSDYNCGYCRQFSATLDKLIETNPDLRVVHREWPIMSQDSVDAAKIVLAAQEQGAYEAMHKAMMNTSGSANKTTALFAAKTLGLDIEKLKEDAEHPAYWKHIQKTAGFAEEISLRGTPAIIIADDIARGMVGIDKIQPILDAAKVK